MVRTATYGTVSALPYSAIRCLNAALKGRKEREDEGRKEGLEIQMGRRE
jgi:hypothetical protein